MVGATIGVCSRGVGKGYSGPRVEDHALPPFSRSSITVACMLGKGAGVGVPGCRSPPLCRLTVAPAQSALQNGTFCLSCCNGPLPAGRQGPEGGGELSRPGGCKAALWRFRHCSSPRQSVPPHSLDPLCVLHVRYVCTVYMQYCTAVYLRQCGDFRDATPADRVRLAIDERCRACA